MTDRVDLFLNLSRSMVVGSVLVIFAVAFVPPSPATPYGAGEALFARFIFWSAILPLAIIANARVRRLRGSLDLEVPRHLRQAAATALLCATSLLWDVVATTLYFLGWAGIPTSVFVLGLATASAVFGLFLLRGH